MEYIHLHGGVHSICTEYTQSAWWSTGGVHSPKDLHDGVLVEYIHLRIFMVEFTQSSRSTLNLHGGVHSLKDLHAELSWGASCPLMK